MPETLQMPSRLDFEGAGRLFAGLSRHRGEMVLLDATDVSYVGALAAQVLLCAARQWDSEGYPLRIVGSSRKLSDGLGQLGIDLAAVLRGA